MVVQFVQLFKLKFFKSIRDAVCWFWIFVYINIIRSGLFFLQVFHYFEFEFELIENYLCYDINSFWVIYPFIYFVIFILSNSNKAYSNWVKICYELLISSDNLLSKIF